MKQSPALYTPTLAEVQSRFADWRKNKKHRSRIPEDLWAAAVMLSQEYSLHKVSRALSLSYTELKRRFKSHTSAHRESGNTELDFIPIDIQQEHTAECIVEMEHRNGNKMRMHFKGKADFDLQSFAESFWGARV